MAALQAYVLFDYHVWRAWLIPAVAAACLLAAGTLAFTRLKPFSWARAYAVGAATAGVLALLVAPAVWAAHGTLSEEREGGLPSAGAP